MKGCEKSIGYLFKENKHYGCYKVMQSGLDEG